MSRVSDLENKIAALERNVGMLAKKDKGAFNIRKTKTALVINNTQIHEYDETAIYDLHIPPIPVVWKEHLFINGGVIRAMTVSDIKKFFKDNAFFVNEFNIVQDINNMSDIYLTY